MSFCFKLLLPWSLIFAMAETENSVFPWCPVFFFVGKTTTETIVMLETAYKVDAIGKTRFTNSHLSIEDQLDSKRTLTSRTNENMNIHNLILEDRYRTTNKLIDTSGVS